MSPLFQIHLNGCSLPEIQSLFSAHGLSAHQARLTFQALHRHGLRDPEKMPELSAKCRKFLRSCLAAASPAWPQLSLDAVQHARTARQNCA